jgi:hypothetical protein
MLTLPRQKTGAEGTLQHESSTRAAYNQPTIDEYLRKRLMPVEGVIPHLPGIEMYGNSIPAGTVGGDLFEYINFQQRYDIDARIQRAVKLLPESRNPPISSGYPTATQVAAQRPGGGGVSKFSRREAPQAQRTPRTNTFTGETLSNEFSAAVIFTGL